MINSLVSLSSFHNSNVLNNFLTYNRIVTPHAIKERVLWANELHSKTAGSSTSSTHCDELKYLKAQNEIRLISYHFSMKTKFPIFPVGNISMIFQEML